MKKFLLTLIVATSMLVGCAQKTYECKCDPCNCKECDCTSIQPTKGK